LERDRTVFTRLDITPLKVNRFGLNLEHSEYIFLGQALADFVAMNPFGTEFTNFPVRVVFTKTQKCYFCIKCYFCQVLRLQAVISSQLSDDYRSTDIHYQTNPLQDV